jgi:hypothetical protein
MPIEAAPKVEGVKKIISWCSNRSGSRILSISRSLVGNCDGIIEEALELNSYDIDYPDQPYAKKVLSFISTLHNPTLSADIAILQNSV